MSTINSSTNLPYGGNSTLFYKCRNTNLVLSLREMGGKGHFANWEAIANSINLDGNNAILTYNPSGTIGSAHWGTLTRNFHVVGMPRFRSREEMGRRRYLRNLGTRYERSLEECLEWARTTRYFRDQENMHNDWGPRLLGDHFHPLQPGTLDDLVDQLRGVYNNLGFGPCFTLLLVGRSCSGKTTAVEKIRGSKEEYEDYVPPWTRHLPPA